MHKHFPKIFLFLIFIIIPTVSASSLTGSFNDYGKDTDSDGLFNYLTIEAEVNIDDPSRDYIIYGLLEDSEGNFIEYNDCKNLAIGKHNFALDFSGTKIYRNRVNGHYNLKYIELSKIDECNSFGVLPVKIDSINDAYNTSFYNFNQFQKGEAAIYCNNSPCIASSDLIKSRDNINVQEPNAPNTIDGCEDGSSGKYLQDESIENITVTSLSHNFFKIGDEIKVEIWVYCDSPYDKLNFVYTSDIDNIQWTVKDNAECTSAGLKKFSTNFILDNNVGQHAIRGVFSYNLQTSTICGEDNHQPDWADTDDVVIYVKECNVNNDCSETECDYLDSSIVGCYYGTYRNYHDMANTCTEEYACTYNTCTDYNNIVTDFDLDGYDIECDNDCDDTNPNINPGVKEICDNGIDDNCNGDVDNNDVQCVNGCEINLNKGWNLISLPKIENNDIDEIIKIFNYSEKIVTLKNGKWFIYDTLNLANSNLNELTEADGFWVKVNNDSDIKIKNVSTKYITLNLTKGWNLIGYPSLEEKNVTELFENVIDDIELIYIYENEFKSFNPRNPNDFLIKPGMGIFVKVKDNNFWFFDGNYSRGEELFNLNLFQGWNLISLPLITNKTVSKIFGSKKLYYLQNNKWKQLQGNTQILHSHGYWVKANESSLIIEGKRSNSLNFAVRKGWNLISYPLTYESNTNIFFNNVMNNIELIMVYEDGKWKSYDPSRPAGLNSLRILKPGKGIFIKAKNNVLWYFDGNELTT